MALELNAEQERVAAFRRGRCVVVAGPGSGKTRVVVERIRRMLKEGTHPSEVVVCTFTVRAAAELETRLEASLGYCGTIHGLAFRLLTLYADADGALGAHFSVLDEQDRLDLLRAVRRECCLKTSAEVMLRILAELEQGANDPQGEPPKLSREYLDAGTLLRGYRERKARLNAEDFPGLINRARLLLLRNPGIAAQIQQRWPHVSVDEAQDNDGAQDSLLELLAPASSFLPVEGFERSLVVVGDPLQSIYRWRGGEPRLFLRRAEEAHERVFLGRNYRSRPEIVELSNVLAHANSLCPPGYELVAERPSAGPDAVTVLEPLADNRAEAAAMADVLRDVVRKGDARPRDVAVLARTNATLELLAAELTKREVPFQLLGANRDRIREPEVRGAIAYAQLALNTADDYALCRALESPHRAPLSDRTFYTRLGESSRGGSFWAGLQHILAGRTRVEFSEHERTALGLFAEQIATLQPGPGGESASPFGWSGAYDELLSFLVDVHARLGLVSRAVNLRWLRGLLGDFVAGRIPGKRRGPSSLSAFVWWLLFGQGPNEHDPEKDAVTLSTVHLSKGLEWPIVLVPDLTEGGFPSTQAVNAELDGNTEAMAEEHRVFFVAATRAANVLLLSHGRAHISPWGDGLPFAVQSSRFLRLAREAGRA